MATPYFRRLALVTAFLVTSSLSALEGLREVPGRLNALAFDYTGRHLYGASSNLLLQINPESGEVLRTFEMGARIHHLETGAGRSIWLGLDKALRRFDTATLQADEPVPILGQPLALAPSPSNPNLIAFTLPSHAVPNSGSDVAFVARDGLVLPEWHEYRTVGLHGNDIFGSKWGDARFAGVYHSSIGPNGILYWDRHLAQPGGGEFKVLGDYVYNGVGLAIHAPTMGVYFSEAGGGILAVNPDSPAVFFFAQSEDRPSLNRFGHPVFRLTGHHSFPPKTFSFVGGIDLVA